MDWCKRMNTVLDYIEDNLDGDIQDRKIAMLFVSSQGMFQKFFAMMTEMPLSEYIRKRRLTQAAQDIMSTNDKIIDIAAKYGYDSAKAFSFAFKQFHGITPSDAKLPGARVQVFGRFTFTLTLTITGGNNMKAMNVPVFAREGIHRYLGDKTDVFLSQANKGVEKYAALWRLSNLSFMPDCDGNLVFSCESELYGPCILRMCIYDVGAEVRTLQAYDGNGYCKLYAYDLTDNVLLLEWIMPGKNMWSTIFDHWERARQMAELLKGLTFQQGQKGYPTYLSWLEAVHKKLSTMGSVDEVLSYLDKAMEIYAELKLRYPKECLLHGNLHQEKLLLNEKGGFTIINPKGVVDDPIMETARFLLNETPGSEGTQRDVDKIREMAGIMGSVINVPAADILKCLFIDAVLSYCWTMEEFYDNPDREGFDERKRDVLTVCKFAYDLL